jgi:hypothetical protein
MSTLSDRRPIVLNPGGGSLQIDDVEALLDSYHGRSEEPLIDLGDGMLVPLDEMANPGDYEES